jgi:hypothetical protein
MPILKMAQVLAHSHDAGHSMAIWYVFLLSQLLMSRVLTALS